MRLLCAAAVSLSLGLFVAYADDKKPESNDPKARAEKLEALKKKFDTELADLTKRLQQGGGRRHALAGIQSEMRELVAITAEKALTIAEGDPKDDTGFAADAVRHSVGREGRRRRQGRGGRGRPHRRAPRRQPEGQGTSDPGRDGARRRGREVAQGRRRERRRTRRRRASRLFLRGYKIAQAIDEEEDEKKLAAMVAEATRADREGDEGGPGGEARPRPRSAKIA